MYTGQTAQATYIRKKAAEAQEIGPLPAVVDPARREACRQDLERFCTTYFSELFYLQFSDAHRTLIKALEDTIVRGSIKCVALPRGSGKTTLCEVACLWALLYSYRRFCVLIASEGKRAALLLNDLKMWLETNPLLLEDFPEVCHPIVALDGVMQRAKTQRVNGERTRLESSSVRIVFPTVAGSPASGARVQCAGITAGSLRGLGAVDASGAKMRPDLVLIDDPSTAESAKSPEQNNLRERLIKSDVLGMAGPGKRVATLITCTVISSNDLADRLLDQKRNPEFHGLRLPLLLSFPENRALWSEYWRARGQSEDDGNRFYLKNQAELDRGARLVWEQRRNDGDPSALVTAMNLYLRDPDGFMSEYQNSPADSLGDVQVITPAAIQALPIIAADCDVPAVTYTAAIDCHKDLLYCLVFSWDGLGLPTVADVLYCPDQRTRLFKKSEAAPALAGTDSAYAQAVRELVDRVLSTYSPAALGVDVGYEQSLTVAALRGRPVVGMKGAYYGARSQRVIADYKNTATQRVGRNWFIQLRSDRAGKYKLLTIDANYWKSRLYSFIESGALSLMIPAVDVRQLTAHLQAERAHLVESESRRVYEWSQIPGADNHLLDCAVYNLALADMLGVIKDDE